MQRHQAALAMSARRVHPAQWDPLALMVLADQLEPRDRSGLQGPQGQPVLLDQPVLQVR